MCAVSESYRAQFTINYGKKFIQWFFYHFEKLTFRHFLDSAHNDKIIIRSLDYFFDSPR